MSTDTGARERLRIYITGDCDGLPALREALEQHSDLELVGAGEQVAQASATLAGGHLDAILHATRASSLPAGEIAAIREQTRTPILVLASGEASTLL
jgi:hypothetical protein